MTRPTALGITLGVMLCLGAAAPGSAPAVGRTTAPPGRALDRTALSSQDEEAIASLLACFHHAARQLHPAPTHAALAPRATGAPVPMLLSPRLPRAWEDRPAIAAALPLSRLNLPPPAMR